MSVDIQWPGMTDNPDRGGRLVVLLLGAREWIHRRVDSVTLGSGGTTRRSMSFDITVPPAAAVRSQTGQVLVPLALIEKGALRRVDSEDPDGHAMPVLGSRDNSRLAAEMLAFLLDLTEQGTSRPRGDELRTLLDEVVSYVPDSDTDGSVRERLEAGLSEAVETARKMIGNDEQADLIDSIARGFLDHFLLVVVIDGTLVGKRIVLKFSYDREIPTPTPWLRVGAATFTLPDVGLTASQHVEFEAPGGLKVNRLAVAETFRDGIVGELHTDVPREPRAIAHVAFRPRRSLSSAEVRVEVSPVRAGMLTFTAVAVAAVLIFSALVALHRTDVLEIVGADFKVPSQAVSLLLLGPALFLSWMARAPEHRTLAALLLPLRVMLIICTAVLILAGVGVAVPLVPWAWNVIWWTVPILGISNAVFCGLYLLNALDAFRSLSMRTRTT